MQCLPPLNFHLDVGVLIPVLIVFIGADCCCDCVFGFFFFKHIINHKLGLITVGLGKKKSSK